MATITTPANRKSFSYRNDYHARPSVATKAKTVSFVELIPWWRTDLTGGNNGQAFWGIDRAGTISGTVLDGSIPVPYALVHLYYKPNGMLIRTAVCTASGTFQFKWLDRSSSDYFSTAHYPNDNAQIYDKLTPT